MPTKKQSAAWYIAATHYLTAGLVAPLIGGLIVSVALTQFKITDEITVRAISFVATLVFIYIGALYAARYINKTYVISNPQLIVNISTTYFVVLRGGFLAIGLFFVVQNGAQLDVPVVAFGFIEILIDVIVFYITSKKYITLSN